MKWTDWLTWTKLVPFFLILFLAAVAVGVIVSIRKEKGQKRKQFEELLDGQLVVSEITGRDCTDWFREQDERFPGKNLGILRRADRELIGMLGYDCPADADLEKYLIQMLVQDDTNECLACRLINYETVAPGLENALGKRGIVLSF